jgi:peroxiredoxin
MRRTYLWLLNILGIACLFYMPMTFVSASEPSKAPKAQKASNPKNKSEQPPGVKKSDQTQEICDPESGICIIDEKGKYVPPSTDNRNTTALEFKLFDAYGRKVHSGDYKGVPVLIMTGACWCGGCQGDTESLRLLEKKYHERGLQVIRSVSYDNELPAWEFQKHYRLPFVQLLDPLREFEKHYNRDGWTFIMLADSEGKVIYRKNNANWPELNHVLDAMLPERQTVDTVERDGISYMPATLKRSGEIDKTRQIDRFPSLAAADDGRMYVAYTTNRNGTQDIYMRIYDGKKWLPEKPIAATDADEFDGTVVVDKQNRPWISWTSDAGGPPYNIFATCASDSDSKSEPTQITHSNPKDGTMHPRMAVDSQGRIWVTYYQWERIHEISRDKEVYAQYMEQNRWSSEIHVSPEDISVFEDHTDPVIAALGNSVVIGWSWDFHRQLSTPAYSSVPNSPSIFLRKVEPETKLERARVVSGANTDTRPAIAVGPDGRIFCAWESAVMDKKAGTMKMIATSIEDLKHDEEPGVGKNATGLQNNICTPCLAVNPKGDVTLVWAELNPQSQWLLKQTRWDGKKNSWNKPKTIVAKGNPRFPSAAYAKDGTLWVAYCADKDDRREVAVLKVE